MALKRPATLIANSFPRKLLTVVKSGVLSFISSILTSTVPKSIKGTTP